MAQKTHVAIRTLQYYDEIGLLSPAYRNSNGRMYTDHELVLMDCIAFYKKLGLSLNEIQELMKESTGKQELLLILPKKLKQLEDDATAYERKICRIEKVIQSPANDLHDVDFGSLLENQKNEEEVVKRLASVQKFLNIPFHIWITWFLRVANLVIYSAIFLLLIRLLQIF